MVDYNSLNQEYESLTQHIKQSSTTVVDLNNKNKITFNKDYKLN